MLAAPERSVLIGKLRYYFFVRYYSRTIRFLLVGTCLLGTLLTAFLMRNVIMLTPSTIALFAPVLAVVGLAAAVVFYNHMQIALLLVLVVSTLMSEGLGTGTGTKISFVFLLIGALAAVWAFKMLVVQRRLDFPVLSAANLPLLLFMLVVIISLLWSSYYVETDARPFFEEKLMPRLMTTATLIFSPLIYLLFSSQIKSIGVFKFFVWWFIGCGIVFAALRLVLGSVPTPLNADGQFPTWVAMLAVGQLLFNEKLVRWQRWGLAGLAFIWLYITLGLGMSWLSGWLPVMLVTGIITFLRSRRLFVVLILIAALGSLTRLDQIQTMFSSENEESGGTRAYAWNQAFDVADDHLLLGTGPAGYAFYFAARLTGFYQLSHNNYIDIISQTGIIGLSLFIAFWLAVVALAIRTYRLAPAWGFEKGLAASLVAASFSTLVVMMLGDWVTPFPYTQGLDGIDYTIWAWMLAGLTGALHNRFQQQAQERRVPSQTAPALPPVLSER